MQLLLDLWCGSKSFSRGFKERGFICLSLDNNKHFSPTFCEDIFTWKPHPAFYKKFDVVTAGPVCTLVSTARKNKTSEDFITTRKMWERTFELVDLLLKPGGVAIFENPGRTQVSSDTCYDFPVGIVKQLRPELWSTTVNYCMYSTSDRAFSNKQTKLWCNIDLSQYGFQARRCTRDCRCIVGGINPRTGCYMHHKRLAFTPEQRNKLLQNADTNKHGKWSEMPHQLIVDLADASCAFMRARE